MQRQKMFTEDVIKKAMSLKKYDRTWADVSTMLRKLGVARPDGRRLNPDSLCASVFEYRNRTQMPLPLETRTEETQTRVIGEDDLKMARYILNLPSISDDQKVQIAKQILA